MIPQQSSRVYGDNRDPKKRGASFKLFYFNFYFLQKASMCNVCTHGSNHTKFLIIINRSAASTSFSSDNSRYKRVIFLYTDLLDK